MKINLNDYNYLINEVTFFFSFSFSGTRSHRANKSRVREDICTKLVGHGGLFRGHFCIDDTLDITIKEEATSYMAAKGIPVDGDPLAWWKDNEGKYPHIAKMARCYLAVPATSVPSERVFFNSRGHSEYKEVLPWPRKYEHPSCLKKIEDKGRWRVRQNLRSAFCLPSLTLWWCGETRRLFFHPFLLKGRRCRASCALKFIQDWIFKNLDIRFILRKAMDKETYPLSIIK